MDYKQPAGRELPKNPGQTIWWAWTDGAPWYSDTCKSLGLKHHRKRFGKRLHSVTDEGYTVPEK